MAVPVDLSHLLSREAHRRKPSKLKKIAQLKKPHVAFLAGGLPLPSYFAWDTLSSTTPAPPFDHGITGQGSKIHDGSITILVDEESSLPVSVALQYGLSTGPLPLMKFLREHTEIIHNIPYVGWNLIPTAGTTQSWCSCLRTFCDEGDSILVEEFCFSSSLETARNLGVQLIPMEMDESGINAQKLDARLTKMVSQGKALPKLIYTIPTGQNPTGLSIPAERRKEIYAVARKYNLLIIEDEPYYFLQLAEYGKKEQNELSREDFLKNLIPSFLSLDTDGRVIRLDSFSKTLAPGSRVGWMTGQAELLENFIREFETSIQTPSGFSTAIISETLNKWGHDGYLDWLKALRKEYSFKRDFSVDSCYKFLPLDVAKVNVPIAGMFLTLSVDAARHSEFTTTYNSDPLAVEKAIMDTASYEFNVVLVPGSWFEVLEETDGKVIAKTDTEIFFRATYAATEIEVIERGLKSFGKALKKVFQGL